MKFRELICLIKSDLYRYAGRNDTAFFLKNIMFNSSFKYSFWMRLSAYLAQHKVYRHSIFYICWFLLNHYKYKLGIDISFTTHIGSGFCILHFGGIVLNPNTVIGKNCTLCQGVTTGQVNRGRMKGYPIIGDRVFIGPGAVIIGGIKIGNNVAIGANCVVTKDIPDNAVFVGVPGIVISYNGSEGYISNSV